MLKIKCKDETVLISRQLKSLEFFSMICYNSKAMFLGARFNTETQKLCIKFPTLHNR